MNLLQRINQTHKDDFKLAAQKNDAMQKLDAIRQTLPQDLYFHLHEAVHDYYTPLFKQIEHDRELLEAIRRDELRPGEETA